MSGYVGINVFEDTKESFMKWKKRERNKKIYSDVYLSDNTLKLGMEAVKRMIKERELDK